jgi:hypothetical protein
MKFFLPQTGAAQETQNFFLKNSTEFSRAGQHKRLEISL